MTWPHFQILSRSMFYQRDKRGPGYSKAERLGRELTEMERLKESWERARGGLKLLPGEWEKFKKVGNRIRLILFLADNIFFSFFFLSFSSFFHHSICLFCFSSFSFIFSFTYSLSCILCLIKLPSIYSFLLFLHRFLPFRLSFLLLRLPFCFSLFYLWAFSLSLLYAVVYCRSFSRNRKRKSIWKATKLSTWYTIIPTDVSKRNSSFAATKASTDGSYQPTATGVKGLPKLNLPSPKTTWLSFKDIFARICPKMVPWPGWSSYTVHCTDGNKLDIHQCHPTDLFLSDTLLSFLLSGNVKRAGYANLKSLDKKKSFGRDDRFQWANFTHFIARVRGDGR